MNQWCVLRMEMHTENWFIMLGVETQKSCLHIFVHGEVRNLVPQKMMSQRYSKYTSTISNQCSLMSTMYPQYL